MHAQAFAIMQESLGRPLEEVFSSISASPVAAASLGQVYKAVLRGSGEEVAIKVQRPGVEPVIMRDLFIFRLLGQCINGVSRQRLGCNAELIVDEFGEKLLEELDYQQEARNIQEFRNNFEGDAAVKIPWVRPDLCGPKLLVMEWIDGIRCTDPDGIRSSGISVENFIRVGVVSGLRQLLEFGLFHGDPHPGNIFALRDGRIAYVDFGNVAAISQRNKEVLIDAVVHAVNEDYHEMAQDFIKLVRCGYMYARLYCTTRSILHCTLHSITFDFDYLCITFSDCIRLHIDYNCNTCFAGRAFWRLVRTSRRLCRRWKRSGQTHGGRACRTSTLRASPASLTSLSISTQSAFRSGIPLSSGTSSGQGSCLLIDA